MELKNFYASLKMSVGFFSRMQNQLNEICYLLLNLHFSVKKKRKKKLLNFYAERKLTSVSPWSLRKRAHWKTLFDLYVFLIWLYWKYFEESVIWWMFVWLAKILWEFAIRWVCAISWCQCGIDRRKKYV